MGSAWPWRLACAAAVCLCGDAVGKGHRVSAAVVRGREFLWPVVEHVRGHNSFHL